MPSSRAFLSCIALTSALTPSTSASRMNSWRNGVQAWPTAVRNWMPVSHSAGVSRTSRAKACRWRTAASMISFRRGSGVFAICASAASVTVYSSRSCMGRSSGSIGGA